MGGRASHQSTVDCLLAIEPCESLLTDLLVVDFIVAVVYDVIVNSLAN